MDLHHPTIASSTYKYGFKYGVCQTTDTVHFIPEKSLDDSLPTASEHHYEKPMQNSESFDAQKTTNLRKFICEAIEEMKNKYPKWDQIINESNTETICIPDNFQSSYEELHFIDGSADDRRYKGHRGEVAVLQELKKLKLGGVLIHGFDSGSFAKKVGMQQKMKKKGAHHFECDFILIHQNIGIIVIEVKACAESINIEDSEVYKKAVKQVDRMRPGLKAFYNRISQNQKLDLPIKFIIWFPYSKFQELDNNNSSIICIDQSITANKHKLEDLFKKLMNPILMNSEEIIHLQRFACALGAHRSIFLASPKLNAIKFQKTIEVQSLDSIITRKRRMKNRFRRSQKSMRPCLITRNQLD